MEIKIVPYHSSNVNGYRLQIVTNKAKGAGSILENRVYSTFGEAQIAQGLASLRYPSEEYLTYNRVCEFEEILKGMLRLAFSEKVWGN